MSKVMSHKSMNIRPVGKGVKTTEVTRNTMVAGVRWTKRKGRQRQGNKERDIGVLQEGHCCPSGDTAVPQGDMLCLRRHCVYGRLLAKMQVQRAREADIGMDTHL